MKRFLRLLHRWLGVVMAIQLAAWFTSGLFFALSPIDEIRGSHLVAEPGALDTAELPSRVSPVDAWRTVEAGMGGEVQLDRISLVMIGGHTWYRVSGLKETEPFARLVNGMTGEIAAKLTANDARNIAVAALRGPGQVSAVEFVDNSAADSEYRGRRLPLWRVSFREPESLNAYVDPWTHEIVATRTARWRIFDFLWMLHIMDYESRDDFNTPLLQVAAAVGLVIVLSGLVYWALTSRARRRLRARSS